FINGVLSGVRIHEVPARRISVGVAEGAALSFGAALAMLRIRNVDAGFAVGALRLSVATARLVLNGVGPGGRLIDRRAGEYRLKRLECLSRDWILFLGLSLEDLLRDQTHDGMPLVPPRKAQLWRKCANDPDQYDCRPGFHPRSL